MWANLSIKWIISLLWTKMMNSKPGLIKRQRLNGFNKLRVSRAKSVIHLKSKTTNDESVLGEALVIHVSTNVRRESS